MGEQRPEWECGCTSDHRMTIGRAWCFDCHEWCYPHALCVRGELKELRRLAVRCFDPFAGGPDDTYDQAEALHDLEGFLREGRGS